MNHTELCKIFEKHGSDKCPKIHHSYSPEYYRLLEPIKNSVNTLIEIGIGNKRLMDPIVGSNYIPGASLRSWNDFFTNSKIIGVDIDTSVFFETDRIKCFYMDQSSIESITSTINNIQKLYSDIDIIIDDGSHIIEHMRLSYKILKNYLNNDGFYIIEDIKLKDLQHFIDLCINDDDMNIEYVHEGMTYWDSFVAYRKKK